MICLFEDYLVRGKVKRKTPDPEEAKALFKQAQERMEYILLRKLDPTIARFVFQDAYEATREAAQALMSLQGFKPYSHEATISFIKKFYSNCFSDEDVALFDHFREIRNSSVYRAVQVLEEDAKEAIYFAKKFLERVEKVLQTE
tara:strand:+ start:104 stop:535 length:432 start_codon:yes stop_codon:yes gene_type:complete